MDHHFSFYPLLLISLLAFSVPLLAVMLARVRLPLVVGEILCGIMIGKSGFNLITPDPWLEFLSLFGFTYLMFLSGLEIDFSFILNGSPQKKGFFKALAYNPLSLALTVFVMTVLLSYSISFALAWYNFISSPYMMTLIFLPPR